MLYIRSTALCCNGYVCILSQCVAIGVLCAVGFIAGGSTIEDRMFDWNSVGSNHGPCVDMFAPATDIMAAHYSCRDCSTQVAGTSYAVPLVSGLVAILLEQEPHLNATQVMQRVKALCTRDALQFPSPQRQDGTPNCLAYIPRKAEETRENGTCGSHDSTSRNSLTVNEYEDDRQGDLTQDSDGNQTSDGKGLSSNDDPRCDNDVDNAETSDKGALDSDGHGPKPSTEVPNLVTTPTPVITTPNHQPVGPDYVTMLSIPASDLQQVLTERMNDGYIPTYVSNNKDPSTGRVLSFIAIFKKTPTARDCKLVVGRHALVTRKTIKAAKAEGYAVMLLHSYLVQGLRRLRFLAVLEHNKTAINVTSFLRYRVRPNAVESSMRRFSRNGYTVSSMAVAFCDRTRPVFTLLSEQIGPERHLDPPADKFVVQMNVDSDQVINTILHFRQNRFYLKDIDTYGGCGNDTVDKEVKHGLLFHHMTGPFSEYMLKLFHSSSPRKNVEDSLLILGRHFGVKPLMAFNTRRYYIVQFKSL